MKAIQKNAFTKRAGKFFGLISLFAISFFSKNVSAQFAASPPGTTTNSPLSLTINGVYFGRAPLSTGANNIGIGVQSLGQFTSGDFNCALGSQALLTVGSAINISANTAIGNNAMSSATTGSNNNCAIGNSALRGPLVTGSAGSFNVAIGSGTGLLTTGNNNTFIGGNAGNANGSGGGNVAIGFNAQVPGSSTSNQLSIQNVIYGTNMDVVANARIGIGVTSPSVKLDIGGELRIGTVNTATPTGEYLYVGAGNVVRRGTLPQAGVSSYCSTVNKVPKTNNVNGSMTCSQIYDDGTSVGVGTTGSFTFTTGVATTITPTPPPSVFTLLVNGWAGGIGFTSTSDKRLKRDIKPIENSMEKISKLRGYTYNWNKDFKTDRALDNDRHAGFLAQEVLEILPEAVVKSEDGIYGLNYDAIMPLLAEGIKEQQKAINELKLEIAELKSKFTQSSNLDQPQNSKEYFQIIPNPVEQESKVVYKLDIATTKAMFIVYDLQGKMLKQMDLPKSTKEGQLPLNKKDLIKGMYILSLIVNSNEVQSKRFLVL